MRGWIAEHDRLNAAAIARIRPVGQRLDALRTAHEAHVYTSVLGGDVAEITGDGTPSGSVEDEEADGHGTVCLVNAQAA